MTINKEERHALFFYKDVLAITFDMKGIYITIKEGQNTPKVFVPFHRAYALSKVLSAHIENRIQGALHEAYENDTR